MELPNKSDAYIPPEKVTGYLLSETHAVGKSKARYFRSHGFHDGNADKLIQGLLAIAQNEQVRDVETSTHGKKYIIDGELETPKGVMIRARTIWIIENDQGSPRFVTAYPIA